MNPNMTEVETLHFALDHVRKLHGHMTTLYETEHRKLLCIRAALGMAPPVNHLAPIDVGEIVREIERLKNLVTVATMGGKP